MLSYILRRILLMVPTLIGISIMVFLLARLAPGTPASTQAGDGQMSAEAQKAQREWYERRYGLDDPVWKQYLNWWKGMFTATVEASSWTDEPVLRPVYTFRRQVTQYFAPTPDDGWMQVTHLATDDANILLQDDFNETALTSLSIPATENVLQTPSQDDLYLSPRHAIVRGETHRIEDPLPFDLIEPVRSLSMPLETIPIDVYVSAGRAQGQRLFQYPGQQPGDDARYYVQVDDEWVAFESRQPRSVWTLVLPTDSRGKRFLQSTFGVAPEDIDGLTAPPILTVEGDLVQPELPVRVDELVPLTVERAIAVSTTLWIELESGDVVPLFERSEPAPLLLVESSDDEWRQLIGGSRVELPTATLITQSNPSFRARVPDAFEAELLSRTGDDVTNVQHALLDGREVPVFVPVDAYALRRYRHSKDVFRVTLGTSTTSHQTVMAELTQRLPVTLLISLTAFPILYLIALPTGIVMAIKRGRMMDTSSNVFLLALWSIPTVLSATLFIGYLGIGGQGFEWFPTNGLSSLQSDSMPFLEWLGDRFWHLVLPVTCIVYGGCAYLAKQMRASMLDNFTMDYVRTAKAKGVSAKDVVFRHVLRNSLLPIITIFATVLPVLIAGSIIIETIFNIEGMGLFTFRAVQNRDYDVVQSMAMVAGVLNLIGLLLADICYAVADPRISYK